MVVIIIQDVYAVVALAGNGQILAADVNHLSVVVVHDHGHGSGVVAGDRDVRHIADAGVNGHVAVLIHHKDGGAVGADSALSRNFGLLSGFLIYLHGRAAIGGNNALIIERSDFTIIGGLIHRAQLVVAVALLVVQEPHAVVVGIGILVVRIEDSRNTVLIRIVLPDAVDGNDAVGAVHEVGLSLQVSADTGGIAHGGDEDIVVHAAGAVRVHHVAVVIQNQGVVVAQAVGYQIAFCCDIVLHILVIPPGAGVGIVVVIPGAVGGDAGAHGVGGDGTGDDLGGLNGLDLAAGRGVQDIVLVGELIQVVKVVAGQSQIHVGGGYFVLVRNGEL